LDPFSSTSVTTKVTRRVSEDYARDNLEISSHPRQQALTPATPQWHKDRGMERIGNAEFRPRGPRRPGQREASSQLPLYYMYIELITDWSTIFATGGRCWWQHAQSSMSDDEEGPSPFVLMAVPMMATVVLVYVLYKVLQFVLQVRF
jgi:hypothetical protein